MQFAGFAFAKKIVPKAPESMSVAMNDIQLELLEPG
jgi:hypothetical protein